MAPQAKVSTYIESEGQPSPLGDIHEATKPFFEVPTASTTPTKVGISFGNTPIYITPRTTTHHGPTPSAEAREYTTSRPPKKLNHDRFPTPASLVLETRRSPKSHTTAPFSPVGVVPRRELPGFVLSHSHNNGPSTLLTKSSAAYVTPVATSHSVLDDGMPDLPPLPTPVVGILIILTIFGFVAAIIVYLLTFPPPREGYFRRVKQKLLGRRRTASAHELQRLRSNDRDNTYHSSDDDDGGEYYSRVSPSTGTSTAYFSPHTPASPFLHTRAPPPPTEAEWLARRRAFDTDEEALNPTTLGRRSGGLLSPLLAAPTPRSPWSPGPDSGRPTLGRSKSSSSTVSPAPEMQSGIRNRRRRPEIKSWLSSIDGVVDRAIGSAARYLSDDNEGQGEFRLPVTQ